MSGVKPALFFLSVPDLKSLCCVTLSLHNDYEEPRSKQMSTCRELVLLFMDVLAAPALDSFTEITAVMAMQFFHRGILQSFVRRHCLQMSSPETVYPGTLQSCVSFSVISRLSPKWNKAGLYLIKGREFLSERGRLTAVSLEMSAADGELCLCVQPNTVRLSPNTLQDLELSPLALKRFCSDPDSVLDPQSTGRAIWCHVLPSLKMGQIISISRKLPRDGPFQSYRELQGHWNRLYGYHLPDQPEEQLVYCSVYFKLVGQRLFTYPLCCVRLSPVQRCPRVDQEGALSCFMADVRETLPSICGFPTRLTAKSAFTTAALTPASRQISGHDLNMTELCSSRAVLTTLPPLPLPAPRPTQPLFGFHPSPSPLPPPPPPPPPLPTPRPTQPLFGFHPSPSPLPPPPPPPLPAPRPTQPLFGSQPSPSPPLSFRPGSLSSQPSLAPGFSDFFKPASTLNAFFTVFESQSSQPPALPVPPAKPKFVPIFRSRPPSQLINVALLKEKKARAERITLPTAAVAAARISAFPANVPSGTQKSAIVRRVPTFSPRNKKAVIVIPDEDEEKQRRKKAQKSTTDNNKGKERKKSKSIVKFDLEETEKATLKPTTDSTKGKERQKTKAVVKFNLEEVEKTAPKPTADSTKGEENSKALRACRAVEKMAESNQLFRVSSSKMLQFLRARGVNVQNKLPKDQLLLKVVACLAER